MRKRRPTADRFWEKVAVSEQAECWLWTATKNNKGYGLFRPGGKAQKRLAHRVSFIMAYGPIEDGRIIMHSCDNPACVNPAHLSAGTAMLNYADMVAKGRRKLCPLRGDDHPLRRNPSLIKRGDDHYTKRNPSLIRRGHLVATSKLTEADVREIYRLRLLGKSYPSIARKFSLDNSTVSDICRGGGWSHMLGTDGCPTKADLLAVPNAPSATKLSAPDIHRIRALFSDGLNNRQIAARFGVTHGMISAIRTGARWAKA